ncbi:MAG: hypothetical protein VYD19_06565 [Myxococcota bacterium]|nr:hypothetical protein [Myxococcota bacterium]
MSDISILMDISDAQQLKAHLSGLSRQSFRSWHLFISAGPEGIEALKEANRLMKLLGLGEQITLIPCPEQAHALERITKVFAEKPLGEAVLFYDENYRFVSDKTLEELHSMQSEGWELIAGDIRYSSGLIRQRRLHPFESYQQQPSAFVGPIYAANSCCKFSPELFKNQKGHWFEAGIEQVLGYALCTKSTRTRFVSQPLFTALDEHLPEPFNDEGIWIDARMSRELAEVIHQLAERELPARIDKNFFNSHIYEYMEMSAQAERLMSRADLLNMGGLVGVATPPPSQSTKPRDQETRTKILRISSLALGLDPDLELNEEQEDLLAGLSKIEEGELLAERGRFDEAKVIFEGLLPEMQDSARLYTNLGVIYWVREESQVGMKYFVQAMKLDRDLRDPVMNFAGGMVELGHLSQALAVVRDFNKRHPDDQPVRELLGELELLEQGG